MHQAQYRADYHPPSHWIEQVHLTFQLTANQTRVKAVSQLRRAEGAGARGDLCLQGEDLMLKQVLVDGAPADYQQTAQGIMLLNTPEVFELTIETEIDPSANSALSGLYASGGALCTQCEAQGFRRITYFLDRPDVLAQYTTTLIADAKDYPYLLSNGNLIDSGQLAHGQHFATWQDPFPKPSYLFALVAGHFDVLRDQYRTQDGRDVALEIFVDPGQLHQAPHAMTSLKRAMQWDEQRFGLNYDLDIYMIVAVDFFNMGAMENKGLNLFNAKYVLADPQSATDSDYLAIESVIGHEYFHNWTGNRVTCRDWFQISLKEGLTVFRDQEFSADLNSRAVNRIQNVRLIRGAQFAEDASPMAHPIRPEKVLEMNNFYTLTVYEKGSEVIRMLHTLLGEQRFQAGMKSYLSAHDGKAATCDDFVDAMQSVSDLDLTQFRLWYSQSGTPLVTARSHYDAKQRRFQLTLRQQTPATADQAEKQALHIPLLSCFYNEQGEVLKLESPLLEMRDSGSFLIHLTEPEQTLTWHDVPCTPILALAQQFSAPIKLNYSYSLPELAVLMRQRQDDFGRWDAAQLMYKQTILNNLEALRQGDLLQWPLTVLDELEALLSDADNDPQLVAEIFTLPSQAEIAQWHKPIDVEGIYEVHQQFHQAIGNALEAPLQQRYQQLSAQLAGLAERSAKAMAARALRNQCLLYLAHGQSGEPLVQAHYQAAENMTDRLAALKAANQCQLPCRAELMAQFDQQWQDQSLVMDQWLALQGSNPAADVRQQIEQVRQHRCFDLSNPNRVRSLFGAFFLRNPLHFHAKEGSGYQLAVELLSQLNHSNPQLASRLLDPLLPFQDYEEPRQSLMRQALERLRTEPLSKDLYEKVQKALGGAVETI